MIGNEQPQDDGLPRGGLAQAMHEIMRFIQTSQTRQRQLDPWRDENPDEDELTEMEQELADNELLAVQEGEEEDEDDDDRSYETTDNVEEGGHVGEAQPPPPSEGGQQ